MSAPNSMLAKLKVAPLKGDEEFLLASSFFLYASQFPVLTSHFSLLASLLVSLEGLLRQREVSLSGAVCLARSHHLA